VLLAGTESRRGRSKTPCRSETMSLTTFVARARETAQPRYSGEAKLVG
jgi:hypothetical protein